MARGPMQRRQIALHCDRQMVSERVGQRPTLEESLDPAGQRAQCSASDYHAHCEGMNFRVYVLMLRSLK